MRLKLLLVLLLCSCATQRQAEKFFDKNTDKLAAYVDKNEDYTQKHGAAYAARHFPPRFYPPAIYRSAPVVSQRLPLSPTLDRDKAASAIKVPRCPECRETFAIKTVYVEDTVRLDALRMELNKERKEHGQLRQKLKTTEAERDYWQEMNRKKLWALIAMAVFAMLYILFKILAARVREE